MGSIYSTMFSMAITYVFSKFVSQYMWINKKEDGTRKSPWAPSPASLPWLWNGLQDFQVKGPKIFTEWSSQCGHFFSVKLGQKRVLVLNNGPLVKKVLVDKEQYNSARVVNGGVELILTDNGKTVFSAPFSLYWARLRRSIAGAVNASSATWFSSIFAEQSDKLIQAITQAWQEKGGEVNADQLRGLVDMIALDTSLLIVMEQSNVDPNIMVKVLETMAHLEKQQASSWTQYTIFNLPIFPVLAALKNLFTGDPVVQHRNEILTHFIDWTLDNDNITEDVPRRPRFAKVFADIQPSKNDPEPEQLKQEEIIVNLMHMTLHSYKYLSTIIFSMIQRLATMPDMQDRLRGDPAFAEAFVKESLRYDPPVRAYAHASRVDHEVDVAGKQYRIDENSELIVNLDAIHFDPDYYVDPTAFSPDRFLHSIAAGQTVSLLDENPTKLPAHNHLTFGAGRRQCLGSRISEELLKAMSLRLVEAYSFHGGSTDRIHRTTAIWSWTGREETIGTTITFKKRLSS